MYQYFFRNYSAEIASESMPSFSNLSSTGDDLHLRKIFVGGLRPGVTSLTLKNYFSTISPVQRALRVDNSCIGYVIFETAIGVQMALASQPHLVHNYQVEVRKFEQNPLLRKPQR